MNNRISLCHVRGQTLLCRSLIIGGAGPKTDLTKGDQNRSVEPSQPGQCGQGRYLSDKLGPGPATARHNGWTIY